MSAHAPRGKAGRACKLLKMPCLEIAHAKNKSVRSNAHFVQSVVVPFYLPLNNALLLSRKIR